MTTWKTVKSWPAGTVMPYSASSAAGLTMEKQASMVASVKSLMPPRVMTAMPWRAASAARSLAATFLSWESSATTPARVSSQGRAGEAHCCLPALSLPAARPGDRVTATATVPEPCRVLPIARTVVVLHHNGRQRAELARRLAAEVGGVAQAREGAALLAVKVLELQNGHGGGAAGRVVHRRHRARSGGGGRGARLARPEAARTRLGS